MRAETINDPKVKGWVRAANPAQSGVPMRWYSYPKTESTERHVWVATSVASRRLTPEGKWECHQIPGRGRL